jgi:hypothetical protein
MEKNNHLLDPEGMEMSSRLISYVLSAFMIFLAACGGGGGGSNDESSGSAMRDTDLSAIYSTVTGISVQVAYEPGAEPYTGTFHNGTSYWSILEANIDALFQGRSVEPAVSTPVALSEMTALAVQNRSEWTTTDIYNLALDT